MFRLLALTVYILYATSGHGIILPIVKPDGNLDMSSLLSHIALLEQTIESKSSATETNELKSQLQTSQAQLQGALSDMKVIQTQLKSTQDDLKAAEIKISQLEFQHGSSQQTGQDTSGATYTRWGKTTCPKDAKIVYKGYAGGDHFDEESSSPTTLCLPEDPIYAVHTPYNHSYASFIYGTEYEVANPGNPFESMQNENMPCVVCESETKRSVIMVPARNQCYSGWSLEYWGYLMGPGYSHADADYICVDKAPEAIPGGHEFETGQLLYIIRTGCGRSLACPPYKNYWEITCAVCTK